MKIAIAKILGQSPYSQSRHYADEVPKLNKESHADYEIRTWRNRMHVTKAGLVEIPGSAFANCIKSAAKRLKIQVPGKGRVEYTKYIEAGVMCPDGIILDVKAADVPEEKLFVPSDGRPGGGSRVTKFFPRIDEWGGEIKFYIFDDIVTESVFRQVLAAAGMTVGIGRFRPENRGFYGRFSVESVQWLDEDAAAAAIGMDR